MKKCPITYEPIEDDKNFSNNGLRQLSKKLQKLDDLPYSAVEQVMEAAFRASKMSIQGVQPKLSAILSVKNSCFEIVDKGGTYILKPQNQMFECLPENEDLTMKLAKLVGIEVPLTGLVYSKDKSFTYFIKRFDRVGKKKKVHVEDFAQLSNKSRDTKYDSSMEKVADIIERYCTFPVVEKKVLFERTIFSFLVGNEDMHLKNFSLINLNGKIKLSPAYDLINTTIVLENPKEQLALPINGKKNKLIREDLIDYFGKERLNLNSKVLEQIKNNFESKLPEVKELINISFLPEKLKNRYLQLIEDRSKILFAKNR